MQAHVVGAARTIARFTTMPTSRPIPIASGEVYIVDDGRQDAAGSNLTLTAPKRHSAYEAGADGRTLFIISACPFKHRITAPPNTFDGKFRSIELDGIGASVELFTLDGMLLVRSARGARFE